MARISLLPSPPGVGERDIVRNDPVSQRIPGQGNTMPLGQAQPSEGPRATQLCHGKVHKDQGLPSGPPV